MMFVSLKHDLCQSGTPLLVLQEIQQLGPGSVRPQLHLTPPPAPAPSDRQRGVLWPGHALWPSLSSVVFTTFVVSGEFSSVLLLEQILGAFCQISRHVSAVICTLKSFPRICLVACVITQVVAISTDSNILKRKGCLCMLRVGEWPIKLNWASKNEVLVKVECFLGGNEWAGRFIRPLNDEWHKLLCALPNRHQIPEKRSMKTFSSAEMRRKSERASR